MGHLSRNSISQIYVSLLYIIVSFRHPILFVWSRLHHENKSPIVKSEAGKEEFGSEKNHRKMD